MATTYYHVKGQTDLSQQAAISATRGGSGGAGPLVTGDTLLIENLEDDIATGVASTVNLERVVISGAGGSIASGVKWRVSNSDDSVMEISGEFSELKIDAHGAGDNGIDLLRLLDVRGVAAELISGDITAIEGGRSGRGELLANCVCAAFDSAGMQWDIGANATAIASFRAAGNITCERSITAGDVLSQCELTMTEQLGATAVTLGSAGAGTGRVEFHAGSRLIWNSRGQLNKLEVFPGAELLGYAAKYPIIWDATGTDPALKRWPGAKIFEDVQVTVEGTDGSALIDLTEFVGMKPM